MNRYLAAVVVLVLCTASCRPATRIDTYETTMLKDARLFCVRSGARNENVAALSKLIAELKERGPGMNFTASCSAADGLIVYIESSLYTSVDDCERPEPRGTRWWTAEVYAPAIAEKRHLRAFLFGKHGRFMRNAERHVARDLIGAIRDVTSSGG